ncbi:MAG: hypothetical protein Q9174_003273 [Haloplaca sp. 1 TL-2023]
MGRAPGLPTQANDEPTSRPPPAPRRQTANLPATLSNGHDASNGIGNEPNIVNHSHCNGVLPPPNIVRTGQKKPPPPALPPRKQSSQPSPALPPRRTSGALQRKDSTESISSTISSISAISVGTNGTARTNGSRTPSMDATRKMAPAFDQASLPPLPPKRTQEQMDKRYQDIERSRMGLKPTKSTPTVTTVEVTNRPALPVRPRQPSPQPPQRMESNGATRKLPPEQPVPVRSALSFGMNKPREQSLANDVVTIKSNAGLPNGGPPPLPLASKPDLSKLLATKPKPGAIPQTRSQSGPSECLFCRDFSGPDNHAAKFPRQTVPSLDWLATQLVAPFTSVTDQARAIFSWLHHNIAYDIIPFINGTVQPSTPASTLSTGLAVCEGYAGLFTALASKAGLESLVVSGHGKGAGHEPLEPGAPIPAEYSTHAWNAVKIDNGVWKLIDPCWGAGHVCLREQKYTKKFSPTHFAMSNEEFGLKHFPTNKSLFYRNDGRDQISWEEYIVGPPPKPKAVIVYTPAVEEDGVAESRVLPSDYYIPIQPNRMVRFQFEKVCDHCGAPGKELKTPYPYVLITMSEDGNGKGYHVFENKGTMWWLDVKSDLLGQKGEKVNLYTLTMLDGNDARGVGAEDARRFFTAKRGKSWGFGGQAQWELA